MPASHFILVSEAGSKPELVAALAMHKDPESLIICNGYKDRGLYSHRAARVQTRQAGHHRCRKAGRARANHPRPQRKSGSSRTSAFGCACTAKARANGHRAAARTRSSVSIPTSLVAASEMLKSERPARIASNWSISMSARRCRTFRRSSARCAKRRVITQRLRSSATSLDISMSAAGSESITMGRAATFDSSTNYSLQEYANDVVWNIMDVCDSEGVAHPAIVSEGGRAIVAHHSVLVMEAFSSIEKTAPKLQSQRERERSQTGARHSRCEAAAQARQSPREPARHPANQGGSAAERSISVCSISNQKQRSTPFTGSSRSRSSNMHRGLRFIPEEVKAARNHAGRSIHLQFFRLPIAARSLGAWPTLSHHADSSAEHSRPIATA